MTTYLCKAGFSSVSVIKSKHLTKVNVKQKMKMIAFNLIPESESLYRAHRLSSGSEPLKDEGGQAGKDYQAPICVHIL